MCATASGTNVQDYFKEQAACPMWYTGRIQAEPRQGQGRLAEIFWEQDIGLALCH